MCVSHCLFSSAYDRREEYNVMGNYQNTFTDKKISLSFQTHSEEFLVCQAHSGIYLGILVNNNLVRCKLQNSTHDPTSPVPDKIP